jgi:hypothetical protein
MANTHPTSEFRVWRTRWGFMGFPGLSPKYMCALPWYDSSCHTSLNRGDSLNLAVVDWNCFPAGSVFPVPPRSFTALLEVEEELSLP